MMGKTSSMAYFKAMGIVFWENAHTFSNKCLVLRWETLKSQESNEISDFIGQILVLFKKDQSEVYGN